MTDHEALLRGDGQAAGTTRADRRATELERKTKELEVFRDAGVLTDAELEEQTAKVRWHLP